MNDKDFLSLKNQYYFAGGGWDYPRVATMIGNPRGINNREQAALHFGYEQAMKDIESHVLQTLLPMRGSGRGNR